MFGKNIYRYLSRSIACSLGAFMLLCCAEPKYVKESDFDNSEQKAKEAKADCSIAFPHSKLCLSWSWVKKPTLTEPGSLVFKIFRLNTFDQTPVETDAQVVPNLKLWMTSMGHGSRPTNVERVDIGTYLASNVFFIMPGAWELVFTMNIEGEMVDDEIRVDINF